MKQRQTSVTTAESTLSIGVLINLCFSAIIALSGCNDPCDGVECANGEYCADGSCLGVGCSDLETISYQGHTYDLVAIGEQCWFAENLRSEKYRNGDSIPGDLTDAQWTTTEAGAQAIYGEGDSQVVTGSSDEITNFSNYGRLYNWYAAVDSRGLCPANWHVPSDLEWTELAEFLGGSEVAGNKLKASSSDTPSWNGSNSSGFSGLPGGVRTLDGIFFFEPDVGLWWSTSPSDNGNAWHRFLYSQQGWLGQSDIEDKKSGFSIRCVRD